MYSESAISFHSVLSFSSIFTGLQVRVNDREEMVKFYVTKVAADSPAKASLLNMIYFNGFFGCSVCEIGGHTTKKGRGNNHSYARSAETPARKRTHARMLRQAEKAKPKGAVGDNIRAA